jgi:hypothetical protein
LPRPKIYKATEMASLYVPAKPLCGTRKAAQSYVDRVTRSDWWANHCPGYYDFSEPPPTRIWVWEGPETEGGVHDPGIVAILNDQEMPSITLGRGQVNARHIAITDKWVILHELAHVMTHQIANDGHHGKQFCYAYIKLVYRFLGQESGDELVRWAKKLKIRMNYSLLLS